jgi:hypothetical protein
MTISKWMFGLTQKPNTESTNSPTEYTSTISIIQGVSLMYRMSYHRLIAAQRTKSLLRSKRLYRPLCSSQLCSVLLSKVNKTDNVRITQYWDAFAKPLLQWKSNKYYMLVCVCMWVPGCVGVCMRIRAYSLPYPARKAYSPYCDVICGPSVSTIFFDIIS